MTIQRGTAVELVRSIFDLQRTLRCATAVAEMATELGIALEGVLRFVGEGGESRASDIAARLGVGASALSRQVSDLAELGLINRRPDPEDGRAQLLSLSASGQGYLADIGTHRAETVQRMLAGWSEAEAAEANRTVEHLNLSLRAAIKVSSRATKSGTNHKQPSLTAAGVN
jgi:DNA-binding MarR family transcriptional regulator